MKEPLEGKLTVFDILDDQPLGELNTLALEARARALVTITTEVRLHDALVWARQQDLPVVPLGEGSNVVLAGNIDALFLRMQIAGIDVVATGEHSVVLRVAAGENWHRFVKWCIDQGYYGLENLALIPGTVGAAPIQNIGAYGVELESVLLRVHALRVEDGEAVTLEREECGFGYRDSVFKGKLRDSLVITAVEFELSREPTVNLCYPALRAEFDNFDGNPTPRDVFDAVVSVRARKLPDPAQVPNAGSFFKNPVLDAGEARALAEKFPGIPLYPQRDGSVKTAAAWMIERCGWKGVDRDGVGVHPEHALVLVNRGANDGRALLGLADDISSSVRETFGIELVIEPRVYP